ncbi:MAG: LCP family protein [Candidatus Sericytochromatia bacterium]|nr:LCP family protein [Candidatus Sericytochromatia bacterium]
MPPSRRRKASRWRKLTRSLTTGVLVLLMLTAVMLYGLTQSLNGLNPAQKKPLSVVEVAQGLVPMSERKAILLLGTDIAYADGKKAARGAVRSDTMLVLGVGPGDKLDVISIPRDTRVQVRGRWDKVNAAFHQGGPKLAAQTVSRLLGIPIHHWAELNTTGLERVVNQLGGVRVYVDRDMHYVDRTAKLSIDFKRGWHTLDGLQAHRYVRFRHDELGDIGRVQRQQQFLRASLERMVSPEGLVRLPQMLTTVQRNVRTNLTGPELMQLAAWGVWLDREDLRLVMLPGQFSTGKLSSYWLADGRRAHELGARLLGRAAASRGAARLPHKQRVMVTVLNGTSRTGLASTAARELRAAGWNVHAVGDASQRAVGRTRVIAQTGHSEWAFAVGRDLGVRAEQVDASVGDIQTDFTVLVGEDYARELGLASR